MGFLVQLLSINTRIKHNELMAMLLVKSTSSSSTITIANSIWYINKLYMDISIVMPLLCFAIHLIINKAKLINTNLDVSNATVVSIFDVESLKNEYVL